MVDPRLSNLLGLKPTGTGAIRGTGKGDVAMENLVPITVAIGDRSFVANDPWQIDLSHVPIAKDIRGLIGWDLLAAFVVRIDPRQQTLALFDPRGFVPGPETAIPLIALDRRIFVDAALNVKPGLAVTHRLRVDTGSENSVNDEIVGKARETRHTVLGNGLGANFDALSGVYDAVHLGPYTWRNVWGPGGSQPAIGMEILRRFVVTFDVPHGRLYLRPTSALNEPVPGPS